MCVITIEKIESRKRIIQREKKIFVVVGWLILITTIGMYFLPTHIFDLTSTFNLNKNYILSLIPIGAMTVYLTPHIAISQCEELDHILQVHLQDNLNDDICTRYFKLLKTPLMLEIIPKLKIK